MTNGTSQGLFVIVAVVIFGIFVLMAYVLFRDKLSTGLADVFDDATTQAEDNLTPPNLDLSTYFIDKGQVQWRNSNGGNSLIATGQVTYDDSSLITYLDFEMVYDNERDEGWSKNFALDSNYKEVVVDTSKFVKINGVDSKEVSISLGAVVRDLNRNTDQGTVEKGKWVFEDAKGKKYTLVVRSIWDYKFD
ncbi:hypothetical protein [Enterococcus gallinarum]|uniref:hypothetical protein n=1 Tax=Enterococcus gallinarum TaxID=1353 RepID=UPI001CAA4BB9|nr:hypothetical protein [Enterococcus gallinarum]